MRRIRKENMKGILITVKIMIPDREEEHDDPLRG